MGDELFDQNAAETTEIIGEVNGAVSETAENYGVPAEAPAETPAYEAPVFETPAYEAPVYENAAVPDFAPAPAETGNILNAGAEVLREIKARVLELDELKVRVSDLAEKQQQLDKDISAKQKSMDGEISSTLTKRRAEVEKSFDETIEQTRGRIKNVKAKRDKFKGTKVDERVSAETAELNEQIRGLKQDVRGIYSREHISRLFNNNYFFTMYMPDGLGDFLIILLSVVILLALPIGIYKLIPGEFKNPVLVLVAIYAGVIVLALLIFTLIFKFVKEKHAEALKQAKLLRDKIERIKKRIGKMEKSIRKDKDESQYGLEKYDEELSGLELELDDIINRKKQALSEFENTAKRDITEEIKARYAEELDRMKSENEAAYKQQAEAESKIKTLSVDISSKYETYLGKENLSVPMLDSLLDIIDKGNAKNVAEAITYYKNNLTGTV